MYPIHFLLWVTQVRSNWLPRMVCMPNCKLIVLSQWLPLEYLIQYRCVRSLYQQFHQSCCISLEPPLQFGQSHSHSTFSSFVRIVWYKFLAMIICYRASYPLVELITISVCHVSFLLLFSYVGTIKSHLEHCDS